MSGIKVESEKIHLIMTFTAFTGAVSHFAIGGTPDWSVWILCVIFTFL